MAKTDNKFERRDFLFEIRAERDEERDSNVIVGRPIVYNSMTDLGAFSEIIQRGALDHTDLTDVRFLVNHDMSRIPLARSRRNNGNSTMQLMPDENGLAIRVSLDTENNSEAKALYSAVQRGDITGMSFCFALDSDGDTWEDMDTDHPVRFIRSISKVIEVSAVSYPAYEATEIYARSTETLENVRSAMEIAKEQRAKEVDTSNQLMLEKAKFIFKSKI